MRPIVLALAVLLGALAPSTAAAAQRVELAGKVTASRTVLTQRRVGEARYVAISDLFYRDGRAVVEVLDLESQTVMQVTTKRSMLERRFGVARNGTIAPPLAEVVLYREGVVGLAVSSSSRGGFQRYSYAELDARSGKLVRTAELAMLRDGEHVAVVGADVAGDAAWFAITEVTARRRSLVMRRLDLRSLETTDEHRLTLPARAAPSGREHAVRVHAAADFARFAVVEYAEDGARMAPGRVYIIDAVAGPSCTVPAPPTAYGVAFSSDGRFVYLGSSQRGTISRVDLSMCRVDKQVAGPRYLHHLVVSRSGTKLFAFASSSSYAVFDLPDLKARVDAAHPAGVAAAMAELHGDGIASLDGAFFVVPEADDRRKSAAPDRSYVIARLID
jgi:DNA-binding beta-propeller fold protein YncE